MIILKLRRRIFLSVLHNALFQTLLTIHFADQRQKIEFKFGDGKFLVNLWRFFLPKTWLTQMPIVVGFHCIICLHSQFRLSHQHQQDHEQDWPWRPLCTPRPIWLSVFFLQPPTSRRRVATTKNGWHSRMKLPSFRSVSWPSAEGRVPRWRPRGKAVSLTAFRLIQLLLQPRVKDLPREVDAEGMPAEKLLTVVVEREGTVRETFAEKAKVNQRLLP